MSGLFKPCRLLGLAALAVLLSGCVVYPAYPGYGYYGSPHYYGSGYYGGGAVAFGGGWGSHDRDWHH